ncbi:MAG: nuclear transport factor 2 family protein [Gemmatimonadetes bacterium]|nr:nuclear transport factor 2 family protein [Gemmatimonadota bacterium]
MTAVIVSGGPRAWGQTTADEKAVMQVIDRINQAYQQRDVKAYGELITADFVRVTPNGTVFDRGEWLKAVGAPGTERPSPRFDELSVRVYGNAALVTYRSLSTGPDGRAAAPSYLTRVLERQGTQWKLAFAQSTDTEAAAPATVPERPAPPPWSSTTAAEREALAAFRAIQQANRKRDIVSWERLSAPEHTIISATGRMSPAERVAELQASTEDVPVTIERDLRLVIKGNLALVQWRSDTARSLKVLALREGRWQQVLHQTSPIVAAK